jgi:hypothetical protein
VHYRVYYHENDTGTLVIALSSSSTTAVLLFQAFVSGMRELLSAEGVIPGELRLTLAKALPAADPGNLSSSGLGNWPSRSRSRVGEVNRYHPSNHQQQQQGSKEPRGGGSRVPETIEDADVVGVKRGSGVLKRRHKEGLGWSDSEGDAGAECEVLDLVSSEEEEEQQQQQDDIQDEEGSLEAGGEVVDLTYEELVGSDDTGGPDYDFGGGGVQLGYRDAGPSAAAAAVGSEDEEDLLEALYRSVEEQQQQYEKSRAQGERRQGGSTLGAGEKDHVQAGKGFLSPPLVSSRQQQQQQSVGPAAGGVTPPSSGKKRYTQPRLEDVLAFGGGGGVGGEVQQQKQQQQVTQEEQSRRAGGHPPRDMSDAAFKELVDSLGLHSKNKKGEFRPAGLVAGLLCGRGDISAGYRLSRNCCQ